MDAVNINWLFFFPSFFFYFLSRPSAASKMERSYVTKSPKVANAFCVSNSDNKERKMFFAIAIFHKFTASRSGSATEHCRSSSRGKLHI